MKLVCFSSTSLRGNWNRAEDEQNDPDPRRGDAPHRRVQLPLLVSHFPLRPTSVLAQFSLYRGSKYQDMQCVANCDSPQRRNFEQPLLQTLTMQVPFVSLALPPAHVAPPGSPGRPSASSPISSSNLASIRTELSARGNNLSSPTLNAQPIPSPTYRFEPGTTTIRPVLSTSPLLSFISPVGGELVCFGYRVSAIFSVSPSSLFLSSIHSPVALLVGTTCMNVWPTSHPLSKSQLIISSPDRSHLRPRISLPNAPRCPRPLGWILLRRLPQTTISRRPNHRPPGRRFGCRRCWTLQPHGTGEEESLGTGGGRGSSCCYSLWDLSRSWCANLVSRFVQSMVHDR